MNFTDSEKSQNSAEFFQERVFFELIWSDWIEGLDALFTRRILRINTEIWKKILGYFH